MTEIMYDDIKVGPYRYRIKRMPREDAATSDAWGLHYEGQEVIVISGDQSDRKMFVTIFHELLHAVAEVAGLREGTPIELEEFITRMDSGIVGLYVENPSFFESLRRAWNER